MLTTLKDQETLVSGDGALTGEINNREDWTEIIFDDREEVFNK